MRINAYFAGYLAYAASLLVLVSPADAGTFPVQVSATDCANSLTGATDATAAINAAIAAAGPGGTVRFPSGVCRINPSSSIALANISLVGSETPRQGEGASLSAGSTIAVAGPYSGSNPTAPNATVSPFKLGVGVTIRGLNITYPYQLSYGAPGGTPASAPPMIVDGGQDVGNVLFEDVHVIGTYDFWQQTCSPDPNVRAPSYGNIRFSNSDIYAIRVVLNWCNVRETVGFDNVISNPSANVAGPAPQRTQLTSYTANNGIWLLVVGGGFKNEAGVRIPTSVGGINTGLLTITAYSHGVLVINDGHLEETMFGTNTTFDGTPRAIFVNSNGSITHTSFRGKYQFNGTPFGGPPYTGAAFTLQNPQNVPAGDENDDVNSLNLNGMTLDGAGGRVLEAVQSGTGHNIGYVTMSSAVLRRYCQKVAGDPVFVSTTSPTAVTIVGSQFTTDQPACHTNTPATGLIINNAGGPSVVANNLSAQGVPY